MKSLLIHIAILGLLVILAFACKPVDIPEPVEKDPVFALEMTVDNNAVSIGAGVDGYVLDADYFLDSLNVYSFTGQLLNPNCANCSSLKMTFRDKYLSGTMGITSMNHSIKPGKFPIRDLDTETSSLVEFNFIAVDQKKPAIVSWDFGDGTTNSETGLRSVLHEYTDPNSTTYDVINAVNYPTYNFNSSLESAIDLDNLIFQTDFYHNFSGNRYDFFSVVGQLVEPLNPVNYLWNFGDGQSSNEANPIHQYSSAGIYSVSLKVDNLETGQSLEKFRAIKVGNPDSSAISHETSMHILQNPYLSALDLGTLSVEWINNEGDVYKSNLGEQTTMDFFTVQEISSHSDDSEGKKILKIKLAGQCSLYNQGGDKISLSISSSTIGVAYPGE
ncbi:MAG: hypothetical protein ACJAZ3_001386 [Sphingobacteriales bacterium]|jgi:hypothetical protein